jgi:hypothetical protein
MEILYCTCDWGAEVLSIDSGKEENKVIYSVQRGRSIMD